MSGRAESGNRGERRPPGRNRGGRPAGPGARPGGPRSGSGQPPRKAGGLNLRRVGGDDFELIHPRCVEEMELDYEEGLELCRAGDFEAAQDALRYALQGCGDNIWVHVALGRIALHEFREPALARGHYGYAFELGQRAIPAGFSGRLVADRAANRPFFEAVEGLAACYDALGQPAEAAPLRTLAATLSSGQRNRPGGPSRRGEPG